METLHLEDMAVLVRELASPVNLITGSRTSAVPRLEKVGVARLSFGLRPMRALLSSLPLMAREWQSQGTYQRMLEGHLEYATVSAWFYGVRRVTDER